MFGIPVCTLVWEDRAKQRAGACAHVNEELEAAGLSALIIVSVCLYLYLCVISYIEADLRLSFNWWSCILCCCISRFSWWRCYCLLHHQLRHDMSLGFTDLGELPGSNKHPRSTVMSALTASLLVDECSSIVTKSSRILLRTGNWTVPDPTSRSLTWVECNSTYSPIRPKRHNFYMLAK